jgi:hypothetical protein
MSLVPRRSLRPSIVLAFVSLALAIASVVEARVIVIRADGSGDVATFQAGIDALLAEPSESEPDTLLVEPGRYDEDVSMEPTRRFEAAIVCPAGPDSSEVRSLRGFSTPIDGVSRLTVRGLTVRDRVALGIDMPKPFTIPLLLIQNCRFMGEVEIPRAYGFGNGGFIGCDFRGRLSLGAAGYHLSHCRFTGQTARLALYTDFFLNVEECVFSGADTAVVTVSNQSDNVYFEQCQFSDVGIGIAVTLDPVAFSRHNYWGVYVKDCRFENITGAAILVTPVGPPPDFVRSITTYVTGSHFDHCGSAIDGRESPPLNLFMEADTVLASSGSGVQASVAAATLQRVMIRGIDSGRRDRDRHSGVSPLRQCGGWTTVDRRTRRLGRCRPGSPQLEPGQPRCGDPSRWRSRFGSDRRRNDAQPRGREYRRRTGRREGLRRTRRRERRLAQ